jgi:hypothetical protein
MKTIALMLAIAGALAAQTANTKSAKSTKKTAKTAVRTAEPLTIPKDAVANADGTYAYTDKDGKKWTYSKTPFGISKIQDMGPAANGGFSTTPVAELTKVTDKGDTVRFERQTPFGPSAYEKKKSELTDDERHMLEAQQPKQPE